MKIDYGGRKVLKLGRKKMAGSAQKRSPGTVEYGGRGSNSQANPKRPKPKKSRERMGQSTEGDLGKGKKTRKRPTFGKQKEKNPGKEMHPRAERSV